MKWERQQEFFHLDSANCIWKREDVRVHLDTEKKTPFTYKVLIVWRIIDISINVPHRIDGPAVYKFYAGKDWVDELLNMQDPADIDHCHWWSPIGLRWYVFGNELHSVSGATSLPEIEWTTDMVMRWVKISRNCAMGLRISNALGLDIPELLIAEKLDALLV